MAKVHSNNEVGAGGKRVLPIEWQEAVPFALELKERWWQAAPAIPERVRYLELQECLAEQGEGQEFEHLGLRGPDSPTVVESKVTILHGFGCDSEDDD